MSPPDTGTRSIVMVPTIWEVCSERDGFDAHCTRRNIDGSSAPEWAPSLDDMGETQHRAVHVRPRMTRRYGRGMNNPGNRSKFR